MSISTANKVVSIALSYVGATKRSEKHRKLVNAFNSVKPHGEVASLSDAWCAEAWTAWQILAGNTQKEVPMSYNCGRIISDAKRLGIWIENDGFRPAKGDAILYDWEDSGRGDNTGEPNHIGMVYDVDDKYIYVVEGNKGSASVCGKRKIPINGTYIRGFVHPHYAVSTEVRSVTVDGWWGYMTTLLSQKVLKTYQDGIVSGQSLDDKKYLPNASSSSWDFSKAGGGSDLVKAIQRLVGSTVDGYMGQNTVKAMQNFLKVQGVYSDKVDGYMGSNTVKAWQKWVNHPTYIKPKETIWDKANRWAEKLCKSDNGKYKVFSDDPKTQKCAICNGYTESKYKGFNCIGAAFAYWRHGAGIPCRCNQEVINDTMGDRLLRSNYETALALVKQCVGINSVTLVTNGGKAIPADKLKKGDIIMYFDGKTFAHMGVDIGNGKLFDSARGHTPQMQCGKLGIDWWTKENGWVVKLAIRYTGKVE